jgi:hypothetical protein
MIFLTSHKKDEKLEENESSIDISEIGNFYNKKKRNFWK